MASITERSNKRNRVQFTVNSPLHKTYKGCLAKADQLKVTIDFCRDFDRWFSAQLDQVSRDLDRLQSQVAVHSDYVIHSADNVVAESAETGDSERKETESTEVITTYVADGSYLTDGYDDGNN